MKKTTALIACLITPCLLSACHKNPLKTHSEKKSTAFLIEAAHVAGEKLHLKDPSGCYVYQECMQQKTGATNCDAMFDAMYTYAKTQKGAGFNSITRAELTDTAFFETIEERYDEALFYMLPQEK